MTDINYLKTPFKITKNTWCKAGEKRAENELEILLKMGVENG